MRRPVAALAVAGCLATGCSSSSGGGEAPSATPDLATASTAAPGTTAVSTWWTATDYCGMLRQTLAAGHAVLPSVDASDPSYAAVTTKFVTDLQHVAPHEIAGAWQLLGNLIITLVRSDGDATSVKGIQPDRIKSAVASVSADAKTRCGLDLSATAK
jgi:hypothetical protein